MRIWNRLLVGIGLAAATAAQAGGLLDYLDLKGTNEMPQVGRQAPLNKLDLGYMQNKGQWDSDLLFRFDQGNLVYWATSKGFAIDAFKMVGQGRDAEKKGEVVRFDLEGAPGKGVVAKGEGPRDLKVDFVRPLGQNKLDAVRGVEIFESATVNGLLPGVSMRHYVDLGKSRHDIILAPGADPSLLTFDVKGSTSVTTDSQGRLVIATSIGPVMLDGLETYQIINGKRQIIESKFRVKQRKVTVDVGAFDRSQPLVVDPLVYGTYLGGSSDDIVSDIASDSAGSIYFAGTTASLDLPVTAGPYTLALLGAQDGFVVGLTEDAFSVNYVAFISGFNNETADFIDVDQYGDVWVAGISTSFFDFEDFASVIRNVREDETVTGGDFVLSYTLGTTEETDRILFDATAAQIETALNDLPNRPSGGFTVVGGPLPTVPVEIRWNVAESPGSLEIIDGLRPYIVEVIDPSIRSLRMSDGPGLVPNDGEFTILVTENNNTFETDPLPFDADGAAVQAALEALPPFADGTPIVVAVGGPLPGTIDTPAEVLIGFFDANGNFVAFNGTFATNSTGLQGGEYGGSATQKAYALRLEKDGVLLDPRSNPTFTYLENTGFLLDFKVRPATNATGPVEFAMVGDAFDPTPNPNTLRPSGIQEEIDLGLPRDCEAIVDFPGNIPSSGQFGFLAVGRATAAAGSAQFLSSKSSYIGGRLGTLVNGLDIDQAGNVYVVGEVNSITNLPLGPASSFFTTTTPIFAGGGQLRLNDGFIRKYANSGSLTYSGVFGTSGNDAVTGVGVDANGNAVVLGVMGGTNFPRTSGTFDIVMGPGKPYAIKFNASATQILYGTALQAGARPTSIDVDSGGNAYMTFNARTTPLGDEFIPVTPFFPNIPGQEAALDTEIGRSPFNQDGGLVVLNSTGTGIFYGGYYGAPNIGPFPSNEAATTVTVDRTGGVWVGGITTGQLIPSMITFDAFQLFGLGGLEGWVVKQRIGVPVMRGIVLDPGTIPGSLGATSTLNVVLSGPAPDPGVTIQLRVVDPNVARFNGESGPGNTTVTIAAGQQVSPDVTVFSRRAVTATSTVIEARMDGDLVQERLSVVPWLQNLTVNTQTVRGGNDATLTVRLASPAPTGGLTLNMTTDSPQFVTFPNAGAVTVPAGQQNHTFTVATQGVDAARIVSISANHLGASVTRNLTLTPAVLANLTIDPNRVTGGERSAALIQLDGKAATQTIVRLSQTGTPVGFERAVLVPTGAREVSIPIGTDFVPVDSTATITASLGNVSDSDTLFLLNNQIQSLLLSQSSVTGGAQVTGTIVLARPAGPTGVTVPILNTKPQFATLNPGTVVVPAGATTANFVINTVNVIQTEVVRFRASKSGYNRPFADLTINPINIGVSIQVNPNAVSGGVSSTGTVTLSQPAPTGGLTVLLSSNNAAVTVPATLFIPAGQSSRTFTVNTTPVSATTTATLTVRSGSRTGTTTMTVLPAAIQSFTFNPASVRGGTNSTGTITIDSNAPAGGLQIALSAVDARFVTFPAIVTVPAGQRTVSFTVGTTTVTRTTGVVFTATVSGRAPMNATLLITGTP